MGRSVVIKVRLDKYVNRNEGKKKRLLWDICWRLFGATTPRAEHDISDPRFELKTGAITIGDNAWIGLCR